MSAVTLTLSAPGAAAQSATIRASVTVVRPAVQAVVLDTAVARAAEASARRETRVELPGGVQVRRVQRSPGVREVRVEFVGN